MPTTVAKSPVELTDIQIPCRNFNDDWKEQYMFTIGISGKPVSQYLYLICGASVSVKIKYNIQRHHETKHRGLSLKYPTGSLLRQEYIASKEKTLQLVNIRCSLKEMPSTQN